MSMIKTFVALEGRGLALGQTLPNQICPVCGGGRTKRPTLAISRTLSGLAYICYRASCDTKGYVKGDRGLDTLSGSLRSINTRQSTPLNPYTGRHHPLTADDRRYFFARFGLDANAKIYARRDGRYVLPITSQLGRVVGYTLRVPVWGGTPRCSRARTFTTKAKSLTYMHEAAAVMDFGESLDSDQLIIVEDQISRIKLNQHGYNAVALLGTHLSMDKAREIQQFKAKQVILALDEDATDKAFRVAKKFGLAWGDTRVVMMGQDVKDTDSDEFNHLFGEA